MSTVNNDYSGMSAGGAPCSYTSLGGYTDGYSMNVAPQGKVSSGVYIVPQWDAITYDSLTAPVPSCSGYSNIDAAYGAGAGSCKTSYSTAMCGSSASASMARK